MLRARTVLRDARGFSLVEVLVAMLTGMVVTGALFAILESATTQTGRLNEVAAATQTGRTTMAVIVDELHSACLSANFAPVQAGSNATKLVFVNGYFPEKNEKEEPEYSFVRKDAIEYAEAKSQLLDTKYQATAEISSGEYSTWKEVGKTILGAPVSQTPIVKGGKEEGKEPIFRYYKYNTVPATTTTEAASTLKEMTVGEVEKAPHTVAAVQVAFRTGIYKKEVALSKTAEAGIAVDETSSNTFALGSPNSEATITAGPCE